MITSMVSPAKTGCRYRYSDSGAVYWFSCPKRGSVRVWRAMAPKQVAPGCFVERWIREDTPEGCGILAALQDIARWYAHDDRNPRVRALLADLLAMTKGANA